MGCLDSGTNPNSLDIGHHSEGKSRDHGIAKISLYCKNEHFLMNCFKNKSKFLQYNIYIVKNKSERMAIGMKATMHDEKVIKI